MGNGKVGARHESGSFLNKATELSRRTFPVLHYALLAVIVAASFFFDRYGESFQDVYSLSLQSVLLVALMASFWLTSLVVNDYADSLGNPQTDDDETTREPRADEPGEQV